MVDVRFLFKQMPRNRLLTIDRDYSWNQNRPCADDRHPAAQFTCHCAQQRSVEGSNFVIENEKIMLLVWVSALKYYVWEMNVFIQRF